MPTGQPFPSPLLRLYPRVTATGGNPSLSLQNINTNPLPDGAVCWVETEQADFRFRKTSTATPGPSVVQPSAGPGRWHREPSGGGGGLGLNLVPLPVNTAAIDGGYADQSLVLRTGSNANPAGAFTGGGVGNKSILGVSGFSGLPIGSLTAISYTFTNVTGPGGPFFIPPGGPTVTTPYCNLIVDFDPLGVGDLRVLSLMDDSLAGAITAAIGTYLNNGSNVLTYAWTSAMDVLIVLAPPNPVPGGVVPNVSVGPSWPENSYSWAALVAANPTAILIDAFTGDGGLPAGAITPAVLLVSGDSANVVKSGKRVTALSVNGSSVIS